MKQIIQLYTLAVVLAARLLVSHGFVPHPQTSAPLPLQQQQQQLSGYHRIPSCTNSLAVDRTKNCLQSPPNHCLFRYQRRSVANVQTLGLFGLGAAELVIVGAAVAFLIGPNQLAGMLGSFAGSLKSDLPEDLKKIPTEFQKGFEESTQNARARNAKPMEAVPPSDDDKVVDAEVVENPTTDRE